MQTFSVAVGEYAGFGFRVNPVDTSIVEFHYLDGGERVIAQFNRNGLLRDEHRVPVAEYQGVKRDINTGKPIEPRPAVEPADEGVQSSPPGEYAEKPRPPADYAAQVPPKDSKPQVSPSF